jgi:two-component system, OmpR family, response regulator CpxR
LKFFLDFESPRPPGEEPSAGQQYGGEALQTKGLGPVAHSKKNMGLALENILMMDKDNNLYERLVEYLNPEGFQVDLALDRDTGTKMVLSKEYSLIIVDVMSPGGDNDFSFLQQMCSQAATPIIVLSLRANDEDRIAALEMGADDYLQKPFNPRELVARVHAILRRRKSEEEHETKGPTPDRLRVGDLEMDMGSRVVFRAGKEIGITSVEFRILEILLRHAGQPVSRAELMRAALERSFFTYDRSIDVHVCKLRKKLGYEISGVARIKSIRGEGYLYTLTLSPDAMPGSGYDHPKSRDEA